MFPPSSILSLQPARIPRFISTTWLVGQLGASSHQPIRRLLTFCIVARSKVQKICRKFVFGATTVSSSDANVLRLRKLTVLSGAWSFWEYVNVWQKSVGRPDSRFWGNLKFKTKSKDLGITGLGTGIHQCRLSAYQQDVASFRAK